MNNASQNFAYHLRVLRERMAHPTEYQLAANYFLDEFAQDMEFIRASEPEHVPGLDDMLNAVMQGATGRSLELEKLFVSHLRPHGFLHGSARATGCFLVFFYFLESNSGIAMVIPGFDGEATIARFQFLRKMCNLSAN